MDVKLPNGQVIKGIPDGTSKQDIAARLQSNGYEVPKEWMQPAEGDWNKIPAETQSGQWGQAIKNVAQSVAGAATGVTGGLAGDVAGLGALAYDATANAVMHPFSGSQPGQYADPAAIKQRVSQALTYQPDDPESLTNRVMTSPGYAFGGSGQQMDEYVTQKTGNTYLGRMAGGIPIALANLMGLKGATPASFTAKTPALVEGRAATQNVRVPVPDKYIPAPIPGTTPEARAQNYVGSRTNLDWTTLPPAFRQKLSDIAKEAGRLESLDATAVERAGTLSSLDVPIDNATRGQLTRNPLQQRSEQLVKATEAGQPLRDIDLAQNKALLDNIDVLRGNTGARAANSSEAGRSIQDTLRTRFNKINVEIARRYKAAEAAGETQGPVNIDRLVDYLKNHEDPAQVSYALSRLKQLGAITEETNGGITVSQNRPLKLAELEGIRRAAVAKGKDGGTAGHYAGELKSVIDDVTEGAGGKLYQEARSFRRALGNEFERQKAVERLVSEKHMSTDRAVALEDTWNKTVLSGSSADLHTVMESLHKSGADGQQALAELRGATIDYIKEKATGGRNGLRNEAGDLNTTWGSLRRAVDDVGEEKMRQLFGVEGARKINAIVDSAQLLKTEAPTGVRGSPTVDKFLTLLDKVPGVGGTASSIVGVARKVKEIGQTGRDIRRATSSPLDGK